jgi:acetyltransferase-like isoleucine patch superfamily enzyme/GT2 family glycosyltransferase
VYDRPDHTEQALRALSEADLASESTLCIYADGPRPGESSDCVERIRKVRDIIRKEKWCREVRIVELDCNKGLAESIVGGVTETVNKHGRAIVLEDDIIVSRGLLKYLNDALEMYADDPEVMHISGCMYDAHFDSVQDTFFLKVMSCQGWATWKEAWAHYNNNALDHLAYFQPSAQRSYDFDIDGEAYFMDQLRMNVDGRLSTWAVLWYASWLRAGGYSLFPRRSLVRNIGFDDSGRHCGCRADSYMAPAVDYLGVERVPIAESPRIRTAVAKFWHDYRQRWKKKRGWPLSSCISLAFKPLVTVLRRPVRRLLAEMFPHLAPLLAAESSLGWKSVVSTCEGTFLGDSVRLTDPHTVHYSIIGDYSYMSPGARVSYTSIGKFCSIGPNFQAGWGVHPTDGVSTSPMFYSTGKQNGLSLCATDKTTERRPIVIGNDVFIGMNVTVLDGVTIGDGAIIGAGCIVSKDVEPYAVVAGNPMRVLHYRFPDDVRTRLRETAWWDWSSDRLALVERHFFDVDGFLAGHGADREQSTPDNSSS